MKTIEERAKEWGEYIAERTPYDVIGAKYSYIAGANEQKEIDDAELHKLKAEWEKEAQINYGIDMKSIEERAKKWSEHIVETTPYDVVNGEVCVFAKDRDIADVAIESYIKGATDQKAIDEKVRLKKSDDMTEAEYDRETAFADWYLKNGKSTPTFSDAIEWARKDVISKACDWLHLNLPNIEYTIKEPKPLRVSRGLLIDELKKAMDK